MTDVNHRKYDLYITYDKYYQTPVNNGFLVIITIMYINYAELMDDISSEYINKTVIF